MPASTATTNGAVLTTHEATIQTTHVEIQVLKVGKKQVTMGMFRQFPYRQILDVDSTHDGARFHSYRLSGVPWGYVQYGWEGDDREDFFYSHYLEHGRRLYDPYVWDGRHGARRQILWQGMGADAHRLYRAILCERLPERFLKLYGEREQEQMRQVWAGCWRTFTSLPQLFIAV